ncbi:hypothetical protein ACFQH9_17520, partial [Pseudonocardia lutea]
PVAARPVPVAHRQSAAAQPRRGEARRERARAIAERLSPDTRAAVRRACAAGVLDGNLCRLG